MAMASDCESCVPVNCNLQRRNTETLAQQVPDAQEGSAGLREWRGVSSVQPVPKSNYFPVGLSLSPNAPSEWQDVHDFASCNNKGRAGPGKVA